jgi:hypothetical protein
MLGRQHKRVKVTRFSPSSDAPSGFATGRHLSGKRGGFDRSMQHHRIDVRFTDGVYDRKKSSRLSPTQKTDIWRRWKAGQSLHEIGHAYGKPHPSIRCVLLPRAGIPPAARRRSRRVLALAEREEISRGIVSGSSIRATVTWSGQSTSTNFQRRDSSAARRYISSSMNERATSGGTLASRWTRGPSFRTGSAP